MKWFKAGLYGHPPRNLEMPQQSVDYLGACHMTPWLQVQHQRLNVCSQLFHLLFIITSRWTNLKAPQSIAVKLQMKTARDGVKCSTTLVLYTSLTTSSRYLSTCLYWRLLCSCVQGCCSCSTQSSPCPSIRLKLLSFLLRPIITSIGFSGIYYAKDTGLK